MLESLISIDLLSGLISFALVLIPAIIVHEIGHFLAARSVGIRILEFGIGIPPRICRLFQWRGTDFTLNWLPLGGFVRPLGEDHSQPMDAAAMESTPVSTVAPTAHQYEHGKAVQETNPWKRMIFFFGGSAANLVSAFVLLTLSALLGIMQPMGTSFVVFEAGLDSELRQGDRIVAMDDRAIKDRFAFANSISAYETASLTVERHNGQQETILWQTATDRSSFVEAQALVLQVEPGSPAARAGIQAGDRIVAVDGISLHQEGSDAINILSNLTTARRGQEVMLELVRQNEDFQVTLVPRIEVGPNQGAMGVVIREVLELHPSRILFTEGPLQYQRQAVSLPAAIEYATSLSVFIFQSLIELPVEIIRGAIPSEFVRPISIVGISQLGGQQIQMSVSEGNPAGLLEFAAFISIALGITNLLPLPALDGGRIFFVVLELFRGRPISPQYESVIHLAGFLLLLTFGVLVIVNDLINPLTTLSSP